MALVRVVQKADMASPHSRQKRRTKASTSAGRKARKSSPVVWKLGWKKNDSRITVGMRTTMIKAL